MVPATHTPPAPAVTPVSPHVSDPQLHAFLQPGFTAADYLNAALPALSLSLSRAAPPKASGGAAPASSSPASLAELSAHTQQHLAQLHAHTARLTAALTQLTGDILRSGGRLAYEVEVLRGEAVGLAEALTDARGPLRADVDKFLPGGLALALGRADGDAADEASDAAAPAPEPAYIAQLRTLTHVRARLEAVIKVFDEALQWALPPSELSLASSLISVSAPSKESRAPDGSRGGNGNHDAATREAKARDFADKLRADIALLAAGGADDGEAGADKATARIQALRDLAAVWKGTAEEKARARFIDSLVKIVDDKQKEAGRARQKQRGSSSGTSAASSAPKPAASLPKGGFLENLTRMRGNIYSE